MRRAPERESNAVVMANAMGNLHGALSVRIARKRYAGRRAASREGSFPPRRLPR